MKELCNFPMAVEVNGYEVDIDIKVTEFNEPKKRPIFTKNGEFDMYAYTEIEYEVFDCFGNRWLQMENHIKNTDYDEQVQDKIALNSDKIKRR